MSHVVYNLMRGVGKNIKKKWVSAIRGETNLPITQQKNTSPMRIISELNESKILCKNQQHEIENLKKDLVNQNEMHPERQS